VLPLSCWELFVFNYKNMAQRRMFSQKIVGSDAFIEMPVSARELYFQLGMYADDDGFINPKKIIRMIGASDDDLKILIGKRFVLPFENGVVVIKHWQINNMIRKDFYQPTIYIEQKSSLILNENKSYTENVNKMLTNCKHNIIKLNKIKLNNITETSSEKKQIKEKTKIQEIVDYFFLLKGWNEDSSKKIIYSRYVKPAKDLLELCDGNLNGAKKRLEIIKNWANSQELDWGIETVFKRWHDLDKLPQEKEKKPFINGNRAYQKGEKWFLILPNGEHKEFIGDRKEIEYK